MNQQQALYSTSDLTRPSLSLLTPSLVGIDGTGIVVGTKPLQDSADKIQAILTNDASHIILVRSTDCSPNAVTVIMPNDTLVSIIQVLEASTVGCRTKVAAAIQILKSFKVSNSGGKNQVKLTRLALNSIVEAYEELLDNEANVNINTSAINSLASTVSGVFQSTVNEGMLDYAIKHKDDLPPADFFDDAFTSNNANVTCESRDLADVYADVCGNNPAALGFNASASPQDSILELDDLSVNAQVYDSIELERIIAALKDLFSSKVLALTPQDLVGTQLSDGGDSGPAPNVPTTVTSTLAISGGSDADLLKKLQEFTWKITSTLKANGVQDDSDPSPNVFTQADADSLLKDHPMLDQDWIVAETTQEKIATDHVVHKGVKLLNSVHFSSTLRDAEGEGRLSFKGMYSKRSLTANEVRGIGSVLSKAWKALKSKVNLTGIASTIANRLLNEGIGAIGSLIGSTTGIKASGFADILNKGLSAFLGNKLKLKDDPAEQIPVPVLMNWVALNVMPNLVEAGAQRMQLNKKSKQITKMWLGKKSNEIKTSLNVGIVDPYLKDKFLRLKSGL